MLLIRSFDSLERLGEYIALFFLKGFTEFGFCIMKDILVSFDEALYSVLQFTFSHEMHWVDVMSYLVPKGHKWVDFNLRFVRFEIVLHV